jgi:hypothetical protein
MIRRDSLPSLFLPAAAALLAASLGGCAQTSGITGFSLLGSSSQAAQAAPVPAEQQTATLTPDEIPPVPTRRPGKRPRAAAPAQTAQASPQAAPPAEAAPPPKTESSGLSFAGLFTAAPDAGGPDRVLIDKGPVDAYTLLAQRIKYCWLNPTTPRLPNHGFWSDLAAGEVKEAKMVVYEKDPDGRRGTSVFKIDIAAESSGSLVTAQNVRLDKTLEASFKADLARWAKGDDRCKA